MLITLELPIELEEKLRTQAEMNQISLSQLIEKLLVQSFYVQMTDQKKRSSNLSNEQNNLLQSQIQHLTDIGLVAWSGNRPSPITPVAPLQKWPTVADLLLENRG